LLQIASQGIHFRMEARIADFSALVHDGRLAGKSCGGHLEVVAERGLWPVEVVWQPFGPELKMRVHCVSYRYSVTCRGAAFHADPPLTVPPCGPGRIWPVARAVHSGTKFAACITMAKKKNLDPAALAAQLAQKQALAE